MNKRRILYVSEADIFGGAERYLLMVLEGLDRELYDPTVALHPEAPRQLVEELEALKVPLCAIIPIRGKRDFFSLIMQRVLFKDKKPDIVHFNISNPYQGQYTMLAARMARVPIRVATIHLPPRITTPTLRGRILEFLTVGDLTRVISVCESSRDLIIGHFGVSKYRTVKIYNGVPLEAIDQNERPLSNRKAEWGEGPVVGTVGRLSDQKGQRYLLEAAQRVKRILPQTKFVIVGDGPLKEDLLRLRRELDLEKEVIFTGWLKDIPTVLSFFDLFVLPSLYESFPFAVLEAMAAQKAVITTRVDGIEEVVEEGGTGLLVSPRDPGALSEGIVALLKDRERAVEMGVRGRRMLETNFTAEQMQRKTGQLYEECLSKSGR